MKLAEALQERADLRARIGQLGERLEDNATVQEGEETSEDPAELLAQLDTAIDRYEDLIARINAANGRTMIDGRTLTEHLAHRECLQTKMHHYRSLISSAVSDVGYRSSRSEIKIKRTVSVKELQKCVDDLAAEYRTLDNAIQAANWSTELP